MKKLEYIAIGNEVGFTNPLLIGKRIISVMKDGVGMSKIVTVAPQDKQAQYINSTGTINFAGTLSQLEDIIVLYADDGNVCFPVTIPDFTLPDSTVGMPYSASFFIGGTLPVTINSLTKPSWLSVNITPTMVIFSGTPSITDGGVSLVSFTISNACGTVHFSQNLNISIPPAQFGQTTFVSGDRSNEVEIANLTGTSGVTITITFDLFTNPNGGILKVNGSTASLGDTFQVLIVAGIGNLNVEINGIADNHGTAILGRFTITSVSAGTIGLSKTYQISKVF